MTSFLRFCGLVSLGLLSLVEPLAAQPASLLQQAQRYMMQGRYAQAVDVLDDVPPPSLQPEGAYLLGRAYQALLRYEQAAEAFAHADTTEPTVLVEWGRSLERIGMPEEAEARYLAAYRQDSTDQNVAASLARLLADRNQWQEVAAIYNILVENDPENSYLHAQLGTAYVQLDSTDQAIIHYERAHGLNPRDVKVVLALTKVYHSIEYYMSARRVVDRALERRPQSAELWRRSGEVALAQEEYPLAITSFEQAVQYGDSAALDLRSLGVSRFLNRDYEAAETALLASYARKNDDALNNFYLGLAKQQLEQYDAALRYLNEAADVLSQGLLADVHARIANVYDNTDRDGDAIRSYRLALTLAPERTEILFHLAALYDAYYADKNTALEAYARFLAAVEEGALPQMENYARQRVQEIRERTFFDAGPPPVPSDTAEITITPDTSGASGK